MSPSEESLKDLQNRFNYHAPPNERVVSAHEDLRAACFGAAMQVVTLCPEGREQSLALTKLEEAMMWANAGVARNHQHFLDDDEPPIVESEPSS